MTTRNKYKLKKQNTVVANTPKHGVDNDTTTRNKYKLKKQNKSTPKHGVDNDTTTRNKYKPKKQGGSNNMINTYDVVKKQNDLFRAAAARRNTNSNKPINWVRNAINIQLIMAASSPFKTRLDL